MRKEIPPRLEAARATHGDFSTPAGSGFNGLFRIARGPCGAPLRIIASEASLKGSQGWEHVSVSAPNRCPNWTEMCFVKDLFWDDEECVVQFHPPRSEYVNNHPYVLHLWRNVDFEFRTPPAIMVGVKNEGVLNYDLAMKLWRKYGVDG